MLTIDVGLAAGWSEEVWSGGNRARKAAAGVGDDADAGVDAGDPASIPCPRMERTTRRSGRRAQRLRGGSGRLGTTATVTEATAATGSRVDLGLGFARGGEKGQVEQVE